MVMPVELPAVANPMVRPVTVTVTAVLAAIFWLAVVMTIWVAVGVATVPVGVTPPALIVTPGVPVLAKKPDGYVSVMVLLVASAPPAVVVNENVAAAVVPATRCEAAAIANEGLVG